MRLRAALLGALVGLAIGVAPAPADEPDAAPAAAAERDPAVDAWLETVGPLLSPLERETYLKLGRPYQRAAFERRFWRARDPFPDTAVNEFAELWLERAPVALARWGDFDDARALAWAAAGEPADTLQVDCPDLLLPVEIWTWHGAGRLRGTFSLVFVARGFSRLAKFRIWDPREGVGAVATPRTAAGASGSSILGSVVEYCSRGQEVASLLQASAPWETVVSRGELLPQPGNEWVRTFAQLTTDLPEDAAPLPAELEVRFPDRRGLRTVVEGVLRPETPTADTTLNVDGEILRGEELFEQFRYRFRCPAGGSTPFLFERLLRPGSYRLVLRLHDLATDRYWREERPLDVPMVEEGDPVVVASAASATADPRLDAGTDGLPAAVSEAALHDDPVSLRLLIPTEELATGKLRIEALARGDAIRAVEFTLDGRPVLRKRRPPYTVELDLGRAPRLHRLGAVGLDARGDVLVRDEVQVNGGPHRFAVRIVDPRSIPADVESVTARAVVEVPDGETLDRVEFYVNDQLHATLFQPPYVQPLPIPRGSDVAWIRVVAQLVDGGAAEDVRLVGAGEFVSDLEVDFVELFASVLDRRKRPVEDLSADEVTVLENGVEQAVRRFERVSDLPIHAAVLLDTSASMAEELRDAETAALRFFSDVLTDRDRAAVMTFDEQPRLVVRFSRSPEVLAGGLADLEAAGDTRIWDAVAFGLHYMSGIRGKRALVLISDGEDSGSRFPFEDVLDYARRTGVTIYAVDLGAASRRREAGVFLDRLARETGGRSFRVSHAVALGEVYREIQDELRAQYLIAYQSSAEPGDDFREIEVRVNRPGVDLRTARGYYP